MRFQLEPDNRNQSDDTLLADLRAASLKLDGRSMSRELYASVGRFSPSTIAKRFGGWGKALAIASLRPPRQLGVTREECLLDLQRIAREHGADTLTVFLYQQSGKFSEKPFKKHFGGWIEAFKAAGLKISPQYHRRTSDEELFENLESVWQALGRQPTVNDMAPPLSRFSPDSYKRRFGGFRKALEAFLAELGKKEPNSPAPVRTEAILSPLSGNSTKGARNVGWRLRYKVLERDRFACRACGSSPVNSPGTIFHVDHVIPWSKGGRTVESNLQTLCSRCNVGKGAA